MRINKPHPQAREIEAARTTRAKAFRLPTGHRKLVNKIGPVHFRQGNKWLDIDQNITVKNSRFTADRLPFDFQFHRLGIGYDYVSKSGGSITVSLDSVGGSKIDDKRFFEGERTGNSILFRDVAEGLDLKFVVYGNGLRTYRILKSDKAAKQWVWKVTGDDQGLAKISEQILGRDASGRKLNGLSLVTEGDTVTESWDGSVIVIEDPSTRIKSLSTDAAYPVTIDPDIVENVATNNDDGKCYRKSGGCGFYANYLTTQGQEGNYRQDGLIRFQGVAVDQGASIELAELVLKVSATDYDGDFDVYGVDTDNQGGWNGYYGSYQAPNTTAHTPVTAPGSGGGTLRIDVTAIVQEIVDRGGWSSGNNMSFVLETLETNGSYNTSFEDYNDAGTDEAQLEITLAAAGNPHNYYAQQQ